jgi:hypothetical protein
MHGNSPSPALLRDDVADVDRAGHATLRVEHHRPIQPGDLAGAQAGLDRQQDHRAIAGGERGTRDAAQHALQHGGRDDFGLLAGHGNSLLTLGWMIFLVVGALGLLPPALHTTGMMM